ncbi:MAG: isoprenylcysteine carboxylmethyltransferase family protein [Nitrospiraceae bacterium]|nr:isoprenylcysteine carboxylmethyltransferase family protein [Nitrospiraceae bacterium]
MIHTFLIFLSFAVLHSIMVSWRFKQLLKTVLGEPFMQAWYRLLFTVVSAVTAGGAFWLIRQVPDRHLWTAPEALGWVMRALQAGAALFGALAFRYLDGGEFLGITQSWRALSGRRRDGNIEGLTQKELVTTGVYGVVRHPLYVAGIVFMTMQPRVTLNGFTVTLLADLYFLFGMLIEERRFIGIFGDQYRKYMREVPRMMPKLSRKDRRGERQG